MTDVLTCRTSVTGLRDILEKSSDWGSAHITGFVAPILLAQTGSLSMVSYIWTCNVCGLNQYLMWMPLKSSNILECSIIHTHLICQTIPVLIVQIRSTISSACCCTWSGWEGEEKGQMDSIFWVGTGQEPGAVGSLCWGIHLGICIGVLIFLHHCSHIGFGHISWVPVSWERNSVL